MKKLLIILFAISFLLFGCTNTSNKLADDSPEAYCKKGGGKRVQFSNGCADSCQFVRNRENMMCSQAFVWGCDCGDDKCWNGTACEKN